MTSRPLRQTRVSVAGETFTASGARGYYDKQRGRGVSHLAASRYLVNQLTGILHRTLPIRPLGIKPRTELEDSDAMLGRAGARTRASPVPAMRPAAEEKVIVMGAPLQGLAESYVAYRNAIEIAEAARQRAIVAALADHRRALEEIEAAYRRDVAAARCRYSQRNGRVAQAGQPVPYWQCNGSPTA